MKKIWEIGSNMVFGGDFIPTFPAPKVSKNYDTPIRGRPETVTHPYISVEYH